MAKPKLAWSECPAATSVYLHAGAESPECLAKRDLRSRDGEGGKIALQREGRATHGVARVAISGAEERFFHGSERSAEPRYSGDH